MTPHEVLARALSGSPFSEAEAEAVFEQILSGGFDDSQIAGMLSLMQQRGIAAPELIGAARVMRRHVTRVPIPNSAADTVVLDTCGTGGGTKTFNISTAVALVVAAASPHHSGGTTRLLVAKHGNRSRTGRGSAEVLAALGVNIDAKPEVEGRCLAEAGVCFCFAIHHHPATRFATPARKSLGFPTIFNLLGPLSNPAGAERQLIGTYSAQRVDLLAQALSGLGAASAMVVHGHPGMDEISTTGPTRIARVQGGRVEVSEFDPGSIGLARASFDELVARDVGQSAEMIRGMLAGKAGPARDIVILNAAAALTVAGVARDWAEGMGGAAEAIDSGRAARVLEALVKVSQ
jgi:anthranilate phosphoribosyltransferase